MLIINQDGDRIFWYDDKTQILAYPHFVKASDGSYEYWGYNLYIRLTPKSHLSCLLGTFENRAEADEVVRRIQCAYNRRRKVFRVPEEVKV